MAHRFFLRAGEGTVAAAVAEVDDENGKNIADQSDTVFSL